jgi:hypothetical protein
VTDVGELEAPASPPPVAEGGVGRLAWAAFASVGAGSIHVAASVIHHDAWQAVVALAIVAAAQLVWGGVAIERDTRGTAAFGLVVSAVAAGGWVLAKTAGIGFVPGLEVVEGIQSADAIAFGLSVAAFAMCARHVLATPSSNLMELRSPEGAPEHQVQPSIETPFELDVQALPTGCARTSSSRGLRVWGVVVVVATVTGLATIRGHDHGAHARTNGASGLGAFDPSKPIDLSGVPGVSAKQQAAATRLVRAVQRELDRYPSHDAAAVAGFSSTGPGAGGYETWIDGGRLADRSVLDPSKPEALVFGPAAAGHPLVAVEFLVSQAGGRVPPDIGGALTTWTATRDLCASGSTTRPVFGAGADAGGECPPGLEPYPQVEALPVWVTAQPCGPFASLIAAAGALDPSSDTAGCTAHIHN